MGPQSTGTTHIPPYGDEHLVIDFDLQSATLDSVRMTLTRKEYDLLALLVQHAGEIIPRDALLFRVWGYGGEIRTRTLDVHVPPAEEKAGQLCGPVHRNDFRHWIPFPTVSRAPVSSIDGEDPDRRGGVRSNIRGARFESGFRQNGWPWPILRHRETRGEYRSVRPDIAPLRLKRRRTRLALAGCKTRG